MVLLLVPRGADRTLDAAGRDPSTILRASSLSISEDWDEVRTAFDWMAAEGIGYLVIEWPGEGEGRVRTFLDEVLPTLG